MKKTVTLIIALMAAFCAVFAVCGCDSKSDDAKLGLKAMDSGDYDRAKRLYNFAIEHGEADAEDERIYEILVAYTDASRCLKDEDYAGGLDILDSCKSDYSSYSISKDMDKLYSSLSDGKYADERIKALSGVVEAGDFARAKTMYEEISKLDLTSSQQDRLYALSRTITGELHNSSDAIFYTVNRNRDSDVAMYSEPDSDSEELCRVDGKEEVEVLSFAENGFIEVYYDGYTGYIKASALSPKNASKDTDSDDSSESSKEKDADEDEGDDEESDKNKDSDDENKSENKSESKSEGKAPVEAISADDTLTVISGVNFRKEPGGEIMDVVPKDAQVTYLGEMENGYYKVEYNGKVGYVYSDYVRK